MQLDIGTIMTKWKSLLLGTIISGAMVNGANAAPIVTFTATNDPQANEENILFNSPDLILGPALTVQGVTNQTHFIVGFTGLENLIANGGQARVEAEDGAFTNLTIAVPGGTFEDLIFNLNNVAGSTGTADITVNEVGGGSDLFHLNIAMGSNFGTILASGGALITSVNFSSTTGIEYADIRQARISGPAGGTVVQVIPEPGSLALAGLSIGLLGFMRRRFSKKSPVAQ